MGKSLKQRGNPKCVELFAGCGGLALAASRAGFSASQVVERDIHASNSLQKNSELFGKKDLPLQVMDVRDLVYSGASWGKDIDLLVGGPPCQPFSLAGKHLGNRDERDMFPEFIRAIRSLRPKFFFIENVRGLTRPTFAQYLEYLLLQLELPFLTREKSESWLQHRSRLKKIVGKGLSTRVGDSYEIHTHVVDAADFGVPQRRHRLFIVGVRRDTGLIWHPPTPSHCREKLIYDKWVTGEYWDAHKVRRADRSAPDKVSSQILRKLKSEEIIATGTRWQTVRDAIADLPDPQGKRADLYLNHAFIPGARKYPGHTGSTLDEPAKTLKAGQHGVPGGENMLRFKWGRVRYFTIRECARLQTFPDNFLFTGPWSAIIRQLGNAVPVRLGEVFLKEIRRELLLCESLAQKQRAGSRQSWKESQLSVQLQSSQNVPVKGRFARL